MTKKSTKTRTITTTAILAVAANALLLFGTATGQTPASGAQAAPSSQATQGSSAPAAAKTQKPATGATTAKSGQTSGAKTATALTLKTPKDKTSYAIGLNVGKSLRNDGVDLDTAVMIRGLRDALAGGKTLLTDDEAKAVLTTLRTEMVKKQQEKMQALAEKNKQEGEAFLAANKTQQGVVTLPSGLQYKILKEGDGPKPGPTDSVVCNYKGTLLNNTEFDSSYKRGQPVTLRVNGVIKGWTEALQLMPAGSKWQLFIPSELAYGQRGAGAAIGPNSTLVFEIELLSIQPPAQPAQAAPAAQPGQPGQPAQGAQQNPAAQPNQPNQPATPQAKPAAPQPANPRR